MSRLAPLFAGLAAALGCRPAYFLVPGSAGASATFTPDGKRLALVHRQARRVSLFDLASRKPVWERPVRDLAGVAFSPRGALVILAEHEGTEPATVVSVLGADGAPVIQREFVARFATSMLVYATETRARFAVSDDGAWLAAALDDGALEVYPARGEAFRDLREKSPMVRVSFEPGGARVAAFRADDSVSVFTAKDGRWSEAAFLEHAAAPIWTAEGLAFVSARGIEVWSGGERRLVMPAERAPAAVPGESEPPYRFSPDGRSCVTTFPERVDVYDVQAARRVFSFSEKNRSFTLLCGAAFLPGQLRAFLCNGKLVDIDLAQGKVVRSISFGKTGETVKAPYHEGGSWSWNYIPALGPDGRFLAIQRPDEDTRVYLAE